MIRKKQPDKDWLILVLSSIKPDHEILSLTYEKKVEEKPWDNLYLIDNNNGFFDGLPLAKQECGKKTRCFSMVEKETKMKIEKMKLEHRMLVLKRKLESCKAHEERMKQENSDSDSEHPVSTLSERLRISNFQHS